MCDFASITAFVSFSYDAVVLWVPTRRGATCGHLCRPGRESERARERGRERCLLRHSFACRTSLSLQIDPIHGGRTLEPGARAATDCTDLQLPPGHANHGFGGYGEPPGDGVH